MNSNIIYIIINNLRVWRGATHLRVCSLCVSLQRLGLRGQVAGAEGAPESEHVRVICNKRFVWSLCVLEFLVPDRIRVGLCPRSTRWTGSCVRGLNCLELGGRSSVTLHYWRTVFLFCD